MQIKVWVCPTEGCGNYYGSSSQAHLDLSREDVLQADTTHTTTVFRRVVRQRGDCPDCSTPRVPCIIEIDIEDLVSAGAPIQEAPASRIA